MGVLKGGRGAGGGGGQGKRRAREEEEGKGGGGGGQGRRRRRRAREEEEEGKGRGGGGGQGGRRRKRRGREEDKKARDDLLGKHGCVPHPTLSLLRVWHHYNGVLYLRGKHYVSLTQCEDSGTVLLGALEETCTRQVKEVEHSLMDLVINYNARMVAMKRSMVWEEL